MQFYFLKQTRESFMKRFLAHCHCGNIEISFSAPITTVVNCHCNNCRRLQGSDFSTWVIVPNQQFTVDKGELNTINYRINTVSNREFCKQCGTTVFAENGKHFVGNKVVPLGIIQNFSGQLAPQIQVYTSDKAQWCSTKSDVPISTQV
jgi:hypothetical protein